MLWRMMILKIKTSTDFLGIPKEFWKIFRNINIGVFVFILFSSLFPNQDLSTEEFFQIFLLINTPLILSLLYSLYIKLKDGNKMVYKLAPDWYYLENANFEQLGDGPDCFPSLRLAKKESDKYRKKAEDNGEEYREIITPLRCLPAGTYFIGDPAAVINDYENKNKWPEKANNVYELDHETYFALYHANLGAGEYVDEDRNTFKTISGDFIIIPLDKIDEKKAENSVKNREATICTFKFAFDTGKDRQYKGAIDFGPEPCICTDTECWFYDEDIIHHYD